MAVGLADIPARFATPDPATVSKLPKPTGRDNTKGHCNECGGYHGLPAVHLDYQGHADVTLALIECDPEWTWEPTAFDPETGGPMIQLQGKRLVLWGRLIVHGVPRLCVGTCDSTKGDPEKELIGDLLRNGAMRFGIATRLWSKADSADPAGSGKAGGYDRKPRRGGKPDPEPEDDAPHPLGERVMAAVAAMRELDDAGKASLKAWADGRSLKPSALLADEDFLVFLEEWLEQYAAGVQS